MIRSVCTYCGVGCEIGWNGKEVVAVKEGIVSKGKLCVKGKFGYQFLNSSERIKGALVKGELLEKYGYNLSAFPFWDKGFFKVPYGVAFSITAKELFRVKESFGGEAIGLIGGARTNCESAYLFQKFGREVLKTPNVDNCARICTLLPLKV